MSTIADDNRRVIAGVDTHKDFHVVVVLDELGRKLETATFSTTTRGYRDLTGWVTSFGGGPRARRGRHRVVGCWPVATLAGSRLERDRGEPT